MRPKRLEDTDVWPDNWKEWAVSVVLLGVTLLSIYAIIATGAYTAFSAQRTATVFTTGDASALLAFNVENEDYARIQDGRLQIAADGSFGQSGVTGGGVNLDAITQVDDVFGITNQGTREVEVWITTNGAKADAVVFYDGPHEESSRTAIDSRDNAHVLDVGRSVTVSMEIDTRGEGLGPFEVLIESITVHAESTGST